MKGRLQDFGGSRRVAALELAWGADAVAPLLVVASGINRVNESRLADWFQEPIGKAHADFVRERTGFVIGGVPPIGHTVPLKTLIDEDLLQYDVISAAAGHSRLRSS